MPFNDSSLLIVVGILIIMSLIVVCRKISSRKKPNSQIKIVTPMHEHIAYLESRTASLERQFGRAVDVGEVFKSGDTIEVIGSTSFGIKYVAACVDPMDCNEQIFIQLNGLAFEGVKLDVFSGYPIPSGLYLYQDILIRSTDTIKRTLIKLTEKDEVLDDTDVLLSVDDSIDEQLAHPEEDEESN